MNRTVPNQGIQWQLGYSQTQQVRSTPRQDLHYVSTEHNMKARVINILVLNGFTNMDVFSNLKANDTDAMKIGPLEQNKALNRLCQERVMMHELQQQTANMAIPPNQVAAATCTSMQHMIL